MAALAAVKNLEELRDFLKERIAWSEKEFTVENMDRFQEVMDSLPTEDAFFLTHFHTVLGLNTILTEILNKLDKILEIKTLVH